jgi:ligand-binding SRPBCC domain-containing protein
VQFDPARWKPIRRPRHVTRFEQSSVFHASPEDVFRFSCDGQNLTKILPDPVTPCEDTDETIVQPDRVFTFRHWMGRVIPVRWVVHIAEFVPGIEYVDEQLRGPFRYFRHRHRCNPHEGGGTEYHDIVEFRTVLGPYLDRHVMRRMLARVFAYRHAMMKQLLDGGAPEGR